MDSPDGEKKQHYHSIYTLHYNCIVKETERYVQIQKSEDENKDKDEDEIRQTFFTDNNRIDEGTKAMLKTSSLFSTTFLNGKCRKKHSMYV